LYHTADYKHGGSLPLHVRIIQDEWANVALPEDYEKILSTARSRNIGIHIVVQNLAQIKALYKDSWENLVGNCDTLLYLGGNEKSTYKYLSELMGKATLDTKTRGITKGKNGSTSENFQNAGRELLTPDEVRMLDNRYALVFLRGERPVLDFKYDLMKHPCIHRTEDGGAAPYLRAPSYEQDDLSTPFTSLNDLEIL